MPLYDYECEQCHRHTEKIQKFSDAPLTECPHCGGHMERVLHAPAVAFKGGGWYADGYGNKKSGGASGDNKASESKGTTESSESKSDTGSKSTESTSSSSGDSGGSSTSSAAASSTPSSTPASPAGSSSGNK